jgi:hypothetical protein
MADLLLSASGKHFAPDDLDPPFDPLIHLRTVQPTEDQTAKVQELREALQAHKQSHLYFSHQSWADDNQLQRFLIARGYNVQQALEMIVGALEWREKRKPGEIDTQEDWEEKMSKESETGKIYCPGYDKWKRLVLVFDNTVQNTPHAEDHMNFLAWNLEFAIKLMPSRVDKYVVFIHLENFSFFNMPPFGESRETLHMLCNTFPERLGHCIAYRPPSIFHTFFNTVKGFLDPRTVSKVVFITGDVSDGSKNDQQLRSIIGDDWKVLTGAEQPQTSSKISPGYKHDDYWPTVSERLNILRASSGSGKEELPAVPGDSEAVSPPPAPLSEKEMEEIVEAAEKIMIEETNHPSVAKENEDA